MDEPRGIEVYKGLPRRIHVGPHTFGVVICQPSECEHLKDADGCAAFNEMRIYLRDNLPLQLAVNVVVHEVTHCINWVYGVNDESTEEQFTNQHATGEIDVFLHNPRYMEWVMRQVRRMKRNAEGD